MREPEVLVLKIGCRRSNQYRQTQEEHQQANGTLTFRENLENQAKIWLQKCPWNLPFGRHPPRKGVLRVGLKLHIRMVCAKWKHTCPCCDGRSRVTLTDRPTTRTFFPKLFPGHPRGSRPNRCAAFFASGNENESF